MPLIFWLTVVSLVMRGIIAAILPLGTDEAYALAVGRSFATSFFDHPPLGFWAPAFAETIGAKTPFGYRVPSLLMGTLVIWFAYICGRRLGGESAGLWTAAVATVTPFVSYAGIMILPDSPLYAGLTGALYALIRLAQGETENIWLWILGGLCLAVAFASKYQAGLLPVSLFIWLALTPSAWFWLVKPGFWIAVTLSLVGLWPILTWNISHDWASFAFHSVRAGAGVNPRNFAEMAVAQSLYLLPIVMILALQRLIAWDAWRDPVTRLLLLIALGPILMFNAIYFFSDGTLPHWSMPGWLAILPLVGAWISTYQGRNYKRWLFSIAALIHTLLVIISIHTATGILTQGIYPRPEWDDTTPLIPMNKTYVALQNSKLLEGAQIIAAPTWIEAGHLSASIGVKWPIRVLSEQPHHFAFMAGDSAAGVARLIGIVRLASARQETERLLELARTIDPNALALGHVVVERGAEGYFALPVIDFYLDP